MEIAESYGHWYEVTEKLDGSSMTVYSHDGVIGVCSRNLDLRESADNTFWRVAREQGLIDFVSAMSLAHQRSIALQGELIGEGIQKNPYKIRGQEFRLFDVFDIDRQRYLNPSERAEIAGMIRSVPIVSATHQLKETIDQLLAMAEGMSELAVKSQREGLVFKNVRDPSQSFKVISNKWLLKHGD